MSKYKPFVNYDDDLPPFDYGQLVSDANAMWARIATIPRQRWTERFGPPTKVEMIANLIEEGHVYDGDGWVYDAEEIAAKIIEALEGLSR